MRRRILIADDEKTVRDTLAQVLEDTGYRVSTAKDGLEAVQLAAETDYDIALIDLKMPGLNGLEVLAEIKKNTPKTEVIIITAFGTVESAVEAIKLGAGDYVAKPFLFDDIIIKIERLLNIQRLASDNAFLRGELREHQQCAVVGSSRQLQEALVMVEKLAQTRSSALITGERGTGKELIARAIHNRGVTRNGRFMEFDCADLDGSEFSGELFGQRRSGEDCTVCDRQGALEIADSTVFLDNVDRMPLDLQAELLRAIENKMVVPVGATEPVPVEARILCATSADLAGEVENGRFREDLYCLLSVVELHMPPLRERMEDIPDVVNYYTRRYSQEFGKDCPGITDGAMRAMMTYSWPGNIRELKNVMERALILAENRSIEVRDLAFMPQNELIADGYDLRSAMRLYEKQHILQGLMNHHYDKVATARALKVGLSSLYRKMDELGIDKNEQNLGAGK